METILFDGKEYTQEEFCELYIKEKNGGFATCENFKEWYNWLAFQKRLEIIGVEDYTRDHWLTDKRQALKKRIEELENGKLRNMYPRKKNRQKRNEIRQSEEYRRAVEEKTEARMQEYLPLSFWEENKKEILTEYQERQKETFARCFYSLLDKHNDKLMENLFNNEVFQNMLDEAVADATKDMQADLEKWLRTEELGFYEEKYSPFSYSHFTKEYHTLDCTNIDDFLTDVEEMGYFLEPELDAFGDKYAVDYVRDRFQERLAEYCDCDQDLIEKIYDVNDSEFCDAADDAFAQVDHSRETVLACVIQNPLYKNLEQEREEMRVKEEEERRAEEERKRIEEERNSWIKASIITAIPEKYPDLYPLARKIHCHFILHIGPTNSGKTHAAMQRIREEGSGIYLAPLRLLAFEQYELLNGDGFPCSLVTGEEREIIEDAKIQASTVEMMDPLAKYAVAVIDEAQMVADKDRGWAWTAAILGVCCPEVHICASPDAEDILVSMIRECDDSYEIVRHERQTKLLPDTQKHFSFPKDVQKGDALIVFSRRNVHAVAYELRKKGIFCSIIYGNLPYDVRQAEAKRFSSGETDVLVATDAIGMGLNLPIRRVVFLELSKYDGVSRRMLKPSEAKQIAGRAGRYGIFDEGFYNSDADPNALRKLMAADIPSITTANIGFPESLIGVEGKLSEIIAQWEKIPPMNGYKRTDLSTVKQLTRELEDKTDNKRLIYDFATIPFNAEGTEKDVWNAMVRRELNGERLTLAEAERVHLIARAASLDDMEHAYKVCDLLYSYNIRFEHPEDIEEILGLKKNLSRKILTELSTKGLQPRKCKYCGRQLPWNHPYGMCEQCHEAMYPRLRWDDDWL